MKLWLNQYCIYEGDTIHDEALPAIKDSINIAKKMITLAITTSVECREGGIPILRYRLRVSHCAGARSNAWIENAIEIFGYVLDDNDTPSKYVLFLPNTSEVKEHLAKKKELLTFALSDYQAEIIEYSDESTTPLTMFHSHNYSSNKFSRGICYEYLETQSSSTYQKNTP